VTYAWRDELEKKTHMAISRAMGQPPPSRGGVMSRSGLRMQQQEGGQFDHLRDDQVSMSTLILKVHGDTHFHVRDDYLTVKVAKHLRRRRPFCSL